MQFVVLCFYFCKREKGVKGQGPAMSLEQLLRNTFIPICFEKAILGSMFLEIPKAVSLSVNSLK